MSNEREERFERIAQVLQQRIAQNTANYEGQLTLLLIQLEDKDLEIAQLRQQLASAGTDDAD